MGLADKLKDLATKAQNEAATHKDQVHKAVLKAEQAADQRTGGQYHDQIVQAGGKADAYVDGLPTPETPAPDQAHRPADGTPPEPRP